MRMKLLCMMLWLAVSGSGFALTNDQANADVENFRKHISTGSNAEIGKAMIAFFPVNTPVAKYEAVLPLANKSIEREYGREYIFWFRGENPKQEGNDWVEVAVDEKSKTIKSVHVNGFIK